MALTAEQKKEILGQYGLHDTDTGSPEAQVALLQTALSRKPPLDGQCVADYDDGRASSREPSDTS